MLSHASGHGIVLAFACGRGVRPRSVRRLLRRSCHGASRLGPFAGAAPHGARQPHAPRDVGAASAFHYLSDGEIAAYRRSHRRGGLGAYAVPTAPASHGCHGPHQATSPKRVDDFGVRAKRDHLRRAGHAAAAAYGTSGRGESGRSGDAAGRRGGADPGAGGGALRMAARHGHTGRRRPGEGGSQLLRTRGPARHARHGASGRQGRHHAFPHADADGRRGAFRRWQGHARLHRLGHDRAHARAGGFRGACARALEVLRAAHPRPRRCRDRSHA